MHYIKFSLFLVFLSNDHKKFILRKKDGQKSDSNDNNNNASNNAIKTPKWCYVAMANTGNGVTTEVAMQWVDGQHTRALS